MRKLILILFLLPAVLYAQQNTLCSHAELPAKTYKNPLYDRWLSSYDVVFYHISLEVTNESTEISGFTTVNGKVLVKMDTLVLELIDELRISKIEINQENNTDFKHHGDVIYIPVSLNPEEMVSATIYYEGDASHGGGFFRGVSRKQDNSTGSWVTYTLSEPMNAKDWFPVKQVLEDKADSVWVDLTCDRDLLAGSNGILEGICKMTDNRHLLKWRSRYPIAYYLLSFSVADYRIYSFMAPLSSPGDSVMVQNFIYDSDNYKARWKTGIDRTGEMISLFSNLILDYPFADEKYGHSVAPMGGGMEHQTMTTLAHFDFTLVAHELAHQWFGDNVTCGNWQDIWINEGFASYMEYIALQNIRSQEDADRWMRQAISLALTEPEGSVYVPAEDVDDVYRVFSYELSYKKGAILLHMLRYELDDDKKFFSILKNFQEKYRGGNATANEFRQIIDSVTSSDYCWFFDQWYYGKGFPEYRLTWSVQNDMLVIHSQQTGSSEETPLFKMHFDIMVETGESEQSVRLFQQGSEEIFKIPVSTQVLNVVFDPEHHQLARSSVIMKNPAKY